MDNNQTWRRTVRVVRQVVVVNIAAYLTAKVPFMTTKEIELAFHQFFSFPLEAKLKNCWLLAIKGQEHRDGFIVTEYTKVCEHHFRPEEIRKQFCGRKDLKDKTIIPSNFSWNKSGHTPVRKSPKKRCLQERFGGNENSKRESEPSYLSSSLGNQNNNRTATTCEDCAHLREFIEKLNMKMSDLIKQKCDVEKENTELKNCQKSS